MEAKWKQSRHWQGYRARFSHHSDDDGLGDDDALGYYLFKLLLVDLAGSCGVRRTPYASTS